MHFSPLFPQPLPPCLENCLKGLGHFVYCPNPGNTGDALIATATLQLFDKLGLSYEFYDEKRDYAPGYTLVCVGGGGLLPFWGCINYFRTRFTMPGMKRCVILPQSIRECPELLEVMDERFTVFVREKQSYDYARSLNSRAQFHLVSDTAFYTNPDLICSKENLLKQRRTPTSLVYQCARAFRFLQYKLHCPLSETCSNIIERYRLMRGAVPDMNLKLPSAIQKLPGGGRRIAWLMRQDVEKSTVIGNAQTSFDLSLLVPCSSWRDSFFRELAVALFLDAINQADIIVTDRLHVSIGAAMLGKQTIMIDNSYGKLSGVWQQSMQEMPHVHFCRNEEEFNDLLHQFEQGKI